MGSHATISGAEHLTAEIENARTKYLSLCEKALAAGWNSSEGSSLQDAADAALYALNVAEERQAAALKAIEHN